MKIKIVIIFIAISLEAVFAGLNLRNVSDISFGFIEFKDVPVFLSISVAFVAGAIVILPFTLFKKRIKTKSDKIAKEKIGKKSISKKNEEKNPFDV